MRKALLSLIIGISMALSVVGCGTGTTENKPETSSEKENTEDLSTESSSIVAEEVESKSEKPEQQEIMSEREEKYSELLDFMDAEDYDSATKFIEQLSKEKQKAEVGDIEDYLVEVELTKDNFFDYFEIEASTYVDDFGEVSERDFDITIKNLNADNGLILYSADEDIRFEYQYDVPGYTAPFTSTEDLDPFDNYLVLSPCDPNTRFSIGRFVGGKVTFIKEEYIDNFKIDEKKTFDTACVITLKNGEVIEKKLYMGQKF